MSALLRVAALAAVVVGVVVEFTKVLPAPGVALVLAVCLAGYAWFLALASDASKVTSRRRT